MTNTDNTEKEMKGQLSKVLHSPAETVKWLKGLFAWPCVLGLVICQGVSVSWETGVQVSNEYKPVITLEIGMKKRVGGTASVCFSGDFAVLKGW